MAGFSAFNRNNRSNNLAYLKNIGTIDVPGATPTTGNTFVKQFTSPGTFTVDPATVYNPSKNRVLTSIPKAFTPSVEILVVAGGGGGTLGGGGGAGGGGGVVYDPAFIGEGQYTVVVGSGGGEQTNAPSPTVFYPGADGQNSQIYLTSSGPNPSTVATTGFLAKGGGGSGGGTAGSPRPGGSGGGAGFVPGSGGTGGSGIQPAIPQASPTAVNYGNPGGGSNQPGYAHSGGGGGAGGSGTTVSGGPAGPGGAGYNSSISGSPYPYSAGAGGGTGGRWTGPGGSWNGGFGGRGSPLSGRGGGCPPGGPPGAQNDGVAATGYGAGGGPGGNFIHVGPSRPGKAGYQGIVILKYTTAS